jgi:mRNA interferase MazF
VVKPEYVPDVGDIVWLDFSPQAGHEQAGRRPAVVLTPQLYNRASGLLVACPVTSKAKGYPFEVALATGKLRGVVLSDQLRSLDWRERKAQKAGRLPPAALTEVRDRIAALFGF